HFFFQAEDGIRDRNVTGVQTCALPISKISNLFLEKGINSNTLGIDENEEEIPESWNRGFVQIAQGGLSSGFECYDLNIIVVSMRSEERRVGKECKSRWVTEQVEENRKI